MPKLNMNEIAQAVNGTIVTGDDRLFFDEFHFDTRLIEGDHTLFFALKGEAGDGHRFVKGLQSRQGIGAVVDLEFDATGITIPLIRVKDPLAASQALAKHVREKYNKIKYIGVTGSAGKTTTKEFIFQLLSTKYKGYRSYENWNNWIGVPFSILKMRGDEEFAVFELAMSDPGIGEIDLLASILKPDVVAVLNVYPVHLEFLKNLENVAVGKAEILNHLGSDGVAFVNGDFDQLKEKTDGKKGRKVYYGFESRKNQVVLKEIERVEDGSRLTIDFFGITREFKTPLIHRSQLENLLTSILVAGELGMKHSEIQEGLPHVHPLDKRGAIYQKQGYTIVDESYNSNPEALKKTLAWADQEYDGQKIAVLGDMMELGEHEREFHYNIGTFFADLHFDYLITIGERAEVIAEGAIASGFDKSSISTFKQTSLSGGLLKEIAEPGCVLLFKASRAIGLENVIKEFFNEN
jgi:UDP-N-acetylmuramoyl-tripeptide--D-alanyl-D-alanine ligase